MDSADRQEPFLFHQGTLFDSFDYLGVHREGEDVVFRVWAPHAERVFAVGDFNGWQACDPLLRITEKGLFEGRVAASRIAPGGYYKFMLDTPRGVLFKADPYATACECPPGTASVIPDPAGYDWQDAGWLAHRRETMGRCPEAQPLNIYELHLGSWRRRPDGGPMNYVELAGALAPYLKEMGYTHVELMPVMEHPFGGSWGYQICGYYAPTARHGTPRDFMRFVDILHGAGIGVILDWVPAHFPKDAHGLFEFDGQPLYEYQGADRMEHRGWGTRCFDVGREEVQCFLISNAVFWAGRYHADGLRVDAVSSMLYLDYGRGPGEWCPSPAGDNRCPEAVAFFRKLNACMRRRFPDVLMIAEESTAWEHVTGRAEGGLGFTFKWNMGWMNDTLAYTALDPLLRAGQHEKLTFSMTYAFSERFLLPLSHDEVVHGKRSLLDRCPGSYEEKFANLRVLLAFFMTHPGKKLLFMGGEIGQFAEWDYEKSVEWFLLDYPAHAALRRYVAALNHVYLSHPALYERDGDWSGFRWVDADNRGQSVYSYRRRGRRGEVLILLNFTPVPRENFRQGVPFGGRWEVVLNSDDPIFGGSGTPLGSLRAAPVPMHGLPASVVLTLPPLSALILRHRGRHRPHS